MPAAVAAQTARAVVCRNRRPIRRPGRRAVPSYRERACRSLLQRAWVLFPLTESVHATSLTQRVLRLAHCTDEGACDISACAKGHVTSHRTDTRRMSVLTTRAALPRRIKPRLTDTARGWSTGGSCADERVGRRSAVCRAAAAADARAGTHGTQGTEDTEGTVSTAAARHAQALAH